MKGVSLHELYITPKVFRTIGFNEEGMYAISIAAYTKNKNGKNTPAYLNQSEEMQRDEKQPMKYYTDKFFIQFNEHSEKFESQCTFRAEIQLGEDDCVELVFQLKKYQNRSEIKSSELINQSAKRVHEEEIQQYSQSRKTVDQTKLTIKTTIPNTYTAPHSIVRKINFQSKSYFSSFVFLLDHCFLGYRIRSIPMTLPEFSKLKRSEMLQRRENKPQPKQPINIMKIMMCENFSELYRKLILSQIKRYELTHKLKEMVQKFNKKKQKILFPKTLFNMEVDHRIERSSLLEYYEAESSEELQATLYKESFKISLQIQQVWRDLKELIADLAFYNCEQIANKNQLKDVEKLNKSFHLTSNNFHKKQQKILRLRNLNNFKYITSLLNTIPFLHFQRSHVHPEIELEEYRVRMSNHDLLFVFAHGLSGNQFDMNKAKSHICNYLNAQFLLLRNIKSHDGNSLEELGRQAALEIKQFLAEERYIRRVNFIGFSLGGVILRACFKHLSEYRKMFNVFITFSTPHLGLLGIDNCLVKTGVFFLKDIKRMRNVNQLCEINDRQGEKTVLEKLAEDESLSWIRRMIVVGSGSDYYIPFHSSLLNYEGEEEKLNELQNKILKRVRTIERIDVKILLQKEWGWEKYTGKKHIYFIENDSFLFYLLSQYIHTF